MNSLTTCTVAVKNKINMENEPKEPYKKKRRFDPTSAKARASDFNKLREELTQAYVTFVSTARKVINHQRNYDIIM